MKRKEQFLKTLVVAIAFVYSNFSYSQTGVVLISKRDFVPFDQWYSVKGKKYRNFIELYSYRETCELQLDRILEDYGLDHTTGELTEEGFFLWELDQGNGYMAVVTYELEGEYGLVLIYVYEYDLKELTELIEEQ